MKKYIVTAFALSSVLSHGWITNVDDVGPDFQDLKWWCGKENATLLQAARDGNYEQAIAAFEAGASAHACNHLGKTAIDFAVDEGHVRIAELLFKHGASPNAAEAQNLIYRTLLHRAKGKDMVELLLRYGASPKIATSLTGETPLHVACFCNADAVEPLIKAGAPINAQDRLGGHTPLYYAVLVSSDKKTVSLLLNHGANPNLCNQDKSSPLKSSPLMHLFNEMQMMKENQSSQQDAQNASDIAQLLFEHGAFPDSVGLDFQDLESWYGKETADKMSAVITQRTKTKETA